MRPELPRRVEILTWLVLACGVSVFTGSVVSRQRACRSFADVASLRLNSFHEERLLRATGLWRSFQERGEELPSHAEIWSERASNYGVLAESVGRVVIWKGQVLYVQRDASGLVTRADLFVNATPCDVGDDHVFVSFDRPVRAAIENGAYAVVVGELISPDYRNFMLGIRGYYVEPILYLEPIGNQSE